MSRTSLVETGRSFVMILLLACILALGSQSPAFAASKIPVDLELDTTGAGAEDFGLQLEKFIRSSDFYVLDKKRTPRIGLSVNAASKQDNPVVTYSIVITITTQKCPVAFMGTIFGDTTGEEPKDLHKKIDKAIMAVAKEVNL